MKQYQKLAMRTSPWDGHDKIDNGLLGRAYSLNRTVGRSDWRAVNGHVQRIMISMSYIACIAGTTLADVAEGNIDKLKKRYPNGFDAETSMRRYE